MYSRGVNLRLLAVSFKDHGPLVSNDVHSALLFQILAKKMTVLYKLAKEQLSKQYHYDFGLRALKSVLVMAGELKRGSPDLPEVSSLYLQKSGMYFRHL